MSNFFNINWAGGQSTGAIDIVTSNVAGTTGPFGGFLEVVDASPAATGVAGLVLASLSNAVFVVSAASDVAIGSFASNVNLQAGGNITLQVAYDGNGVSISNATNGGYGLLTVDSNSDLYWNGTKLN